jgi:threonine dehydrogenase-like Zn-dependent dehydrogenase
MQSLVCSQPRKLEYKNIQSPLLTENHAIIKIKRIGVCGTDLHRVP